MIASKLNIVVPMAGHGSRFAKAGYKDPKPLIPMGNKTMIEVVIDNLRPSCPHRFIFIVQQMQIERYGLNQHLQSIAPGSVIIPVTEVTQGAACSVLLAKEYINNDQALMIANCDQFIEAKIDDYLASMAGLDGLIMTMTATDPKWSFVRLDEQKNITEVLEKQPVSDEATVGIYNFARGADFVWAAEEMIRQDLRVNNEFYVAPTYNALIAKGAKLGFYNIGSEREGMYGLGIPDDLEYFMAAQFARLVAK